MRTPFVAFGIIGLASAILAGAQTNEVTPKNLGGWTVTGAEQSSLEAKSTLTLPAGSQISRAFQAGGLSVDAVTQPVLGAIAKDWPILEVGPAALVFARKGDSGQLIVAIGDEPPVALPVTIALDSEGRSTEPIAVTMAVIDRVITVGADDQTWQFPIAAAAAQEVVASAGAEHAWSFDALQVTGTALVVTGDARANAGARAGRETNANSSSANSSDGEASPNRVLSMGTLQLAAPPAPKPQAEKTGPPRPLEVFTPPSVRHGRADAVRATLLRTSKP